MARLVQKYGGTSVGSIDRIFAVADRIKDSVDAGHQVAVVVSAMAGETNRLIDLAAAVTPVPDAREHDSIVASGEQVSSGLLALALQARGLSARSWHGWQVPVVTNDAHGKARIDRIETANLEQRLNRGEVVILAGFQGVTPDGRIATLGRGGSDTSAVALAAALRADRCDIFTDVDGVYTTDPRIESKAKKLSKITFEEMLELASLGAKVLHTRAVELAMKQGVRLQVLSSFTDVPGTMVVGDDEVLEQELVSGIAYSRNEAKITLVHVADRPGVAAAIFGPLASANINVDMIVQNVGIESNATDVTFTVNQPDLERAVNVIKNNFESINYRDLIWDDNVVKISVVGVGMRSHSGVAEKMFHVLAEKGINIQVISTSEIKISVLIDEMFTELAIRALHAAYGLDGS